MSERRRVQGIFFEHPILNAVLEWLERLRERWRTRPGSSAETGTRQGSLQTTMKNIETVHWIDYKGRKRELVIEREVKS